MELKDILLFLNPLIGVIVGSYITYFFAIKTKKEEAIFRFKEEKYSNLLILMQGFLGSDASDELKRKFFEEQYGSWLYCSDGVVKSINEMIDFIIKHKGEEVSMDKSRELVGNIVLEMRKDLVKKTDLTYDDFRYKEVIGKK